MAATPAAAARGQGARESTARGENGEDEGEERVSNPKRPRKACRCGSWQHQKTSHRDCPLNNSNSKASTGGGDGGGDDHDHEGPAGAQTPAPLITVQALRQELVDNGMDAAVCEEMEDVHELRALLEHHREAATAQPSVRNAQSLGVA